MVMAPMVEREDWTHYVQRITSGVSRKDVARAAGIHESGLHRWLNDKNKPRVEKIVGFARGLGQSPVEALIAAGHLNPEEVAGVIEVYQSRSELSDDELIAELAERLATRPPGPNTDDITHRLARPNNFSEGVVDEE